MREETLALAIVQVCHTHLVTIHLCILPPCQWTLTDSYFEYIILQAGLYKE